MYGPVLGATTTTAAAMTLPVTGSNQFMQIAVLSALVGGIIITIVSLARISALKANK